MTGSSRLLLFTMVITLVASSMAIPAPIQIAGNPQEIVLSSTSMRTVRLELLPLDAEGKPKPSPESTVLMPLVTNEALRVRELDGARDLQIGQMRVSIKPQPLT